MSWDLAKSEATSLFHSAEREATIIAHEIPHLAKVSGEAALHAAIQDPIDAVTQLANHVVKPLTGYELPPLQLIDAPPPAKAGSEDFYAELIGTSIGRAFDYAALAVTMNAVGITAALGSALGAADASIGSDITAQAATHPGLFKLASTFGNATLTGGIFGSLLVPTKTADGEPQFWKDRAINGIGWGLAAGAAATIAAEATMAFKSLGMTIEDAVFPSTPTALSTLAISKALGGSGSSLVQNEVSNLFGHGLSTTTTHALSGSLVR